MQFTTLVNQTKKNNKNTEKKLLNVYILFGIYSKNNLTQLFVSAFFSNMHTTTCLSFKDSKYMMRLLYNLKTVHFIYIFVDNINVM